MMVHQCVSCVVVRASPCHFPQELLALPPFSKERKRSGSGPPEKTDRKQNYPPQGDRVGCVEEVDCVLCVLLFFDKRVEGRTEQGRQELLGLGNRLGSWNIKLGQGWDFLKQVTPDFIFEHFECYGCCW
jgi:hypothetical protein